MKYTAIAISTILLLFSYTPAFARTDIVNNIKATAESGEGGNASSTVNVSNQVGSNSDSNTSNSKIETNVEIHQEGGGTSEVTINGKTWKQEGPGDTSVHESTEGTDNSSNEATESSETETPTDSGDQEDQKVLSAEDENISPIVKAVRQFVESIRKFFKNLF